MDIKFTGDLAWWQGLFLAALLGGAAWWLYRRELGRGATGWTAWWLPVSRVIVVVLMALVLIGPVLRRRHVEGRLGRVVVVVDGSASMGLADPHMDDGRKLLGAVAQGWVEDEGAGSPLSKASHAVAMARRLAAEGSPEAAGAFEAALERLGEVDPKLLAGGAPARGSIGVEYYDGVADLDSVRKVGKAPSHYERRDRFASTPNRADGYATRIRGFLHPPKTGAYTFWITSDDSSELRVSSGEQPSSGPPIARVSSFVPEDAWDATTEQKSVPITLQEGRRYYVEALHLAGGGGDYVAVGWEQPGGRRERPIPGAHLSPVSGDAGTPTSDAIAQQFRTELVQPAAAAGGDPAKLMALAPAAAAWERRLSDAFARHAAGKAASGDPAMVSAIQRFAGAARLERAEGLLLDRRHGLVGALDKTHKVDLVALSEGRAVRLWQSEGTGEWPQKSGIQTAAATTDLAGGVQAYLDEALEEGEHAAVVVMSDGRHNAGASPVAMAKVLGARKVPVHTVSFGSTTAPPDVSIVGVDGPESVYKEGRVKGQVTVNDTMAPGKPIPLRITDGTSLVWETTVTTSGAGRRTVEFDFPVEEIVKRRQQNAPSDVEVTSASVSLKVEMTPPDGDAKPDNNTSGMRFRAVTRGRNVLLVDGRPRWDTRYVRNLLERDKQWTTTSLIARSTPEGDEPWVRGDAAGQFPKDVKTLNNYDLIVFGEVPEGWLKAEELQWIRDFVEKRAGGIVFVDGQRGHLRKLLAGPMGALLPVSWEPGDPVRMAEKLRLTKSGESLAALRLEGESARNVELWGYLPPPHWSASAKALEGTEVLVEAVKGDRAAPAMVMRRFGAGRVLYLASDESWRWRYEVADKYHTRFWTQLVDWLMEPPYAVQDKFVSLDVGAVRAKTGERVPIKARLRGRDGAPLLEAEAEAVLYRDGKRLASVALKEDEGQSGVYRGLTAELEPGEYDVGVLVETFSELEMKARTGFTVAAGDSGELAELTSNEDLMREIAVASGGTFLREEEAARLEDVLRPLSEGKIVVLETALSESYLWFLPLIALLTVEWVVRRRTGML